MKKTLLIMFSYVFILSTSVFPQILTENFDYPAGDSLRGHGWNITGTSTLNTVLVVSPGLTYAGYPLSGIGNAAGLTTTGQDVNKQYSDSVTSGPVYASFMVNITDAQAAGDYFFHLGVNPTNTFDFFARIWVKQAANGNLCFGISKTSVNASNPVVYSDSIYTTGTTYLFVVKYMINAGAADDTANLFINPAISPIEPAANLTAATTQTDAVSLGTVNLRQGTASNAANLIIDGIRAATTWSEVIPVELTSFTAEVNKGKVILNWSTASEKNNRGFEVQRKTDGDFNVIGFVDGNGTTSETNSYTFADKYAAAGKCIYRLKQLDFNGAFEYSNEIEVDVTVPQAFGLNQNYPNPFNPSTQVSFSLPVDSKVTLTLFNILGKEVAVITNGLYASGTHYIKVNGENLTSGIYLYKLEAAGIDGSIYSSVKKMILAK